MTWEYDVAGPSVVALTGELPREANLALGFATSKEAAATLAVSDLMVAFSVVWKAQCEVWEKWLSAVRRPSRSAQGPWAWNASSGLAASLSGIGIANMLIRYGWGAAYIIMAILTVVAIGLCLLLWTVRPREA